MRKFCCVILALAMLLCTATALAWNESNADQYEKALGLLKECRYAEAADAFSALGGYGESMRYTMYCRAVAAGESGRYATAVENLNSLGDFLDSQLLAVYFSGLSFEAAEDYERAQEILDGIALYRDAADRMAGYPGLILKRDYRMADACEQAGMLEAACREFERLGDYEDSAERSAAVKEKIAAKEQQEAEAARAAAYAAADQAEQAGDYAGAYNGFSALGDYLNSAERAAAVQLMGNYAQGLQHAMEGRFSKAYETFSALGDYEDSAQKAYVLGVTAFANVKDMGNGIARFEFHDTWGLINVKENVISAPFWNEIEDFDSHGLARVEKDGLYGCINTRGEPVVDCVWESTGYTNKFGLVRVEKDDKYGYVNTNGEVVVDCRWDQVSGFSDEGYCTVARCEVDETGWNKIEYYYLGLMDHKGNMILKDEWQRIGDAQNSTWGSYYNNCWMYEPVFSDGRIKVQNAEGLYGFKDEAGNSVGEIRWDAIGNFSQGLAMVAENNLYGYIGLDGQVVIEPQYRRAMDFSEGLAAVQKGMGWMYINAGNEQVIPPLFEQVTSFSGGKADVLLNGVGWMIIDPQGELLYFRNEATRAAYEAARAARVMDGAEGGTNITGGEVLTGTAKGFQSEVWVTVTLADGVIMDIAVDSTGETTGLGTRCGEDETFLSQFIGKSIPVEGIDALSGATVTSKAVVEAVNSLDE